MFQRPSGSSRTRRSVRILRDDHRRAVEIHETDTGGCGVRQGPEASGEQPGSPFFLAHDQEGRCVIPEDEQVGVAVVVDVQGLDGRRYARDFGQGDRLDAAPMLAAEFPDFSRQARSSNESAPDFGQLSAWCE